MSMLDTRRDQIFPVLTTDQIEQARRFASAPARCFSPNEPMFRVGERNMPSFIVVNGKVEVYRHDGLSRESLITVHERGAITGELSALVGGAALAEGRAGPEGCEV